MKRINLGFVPTDANQLLAFVVSVWRQKEINKEESERRKEGEKETRIN